MTLRAMLIALFVLGAGLTVIAAVALFKKLFSGSGSIKMLGIEIKGQGAHVIFLLVGAALLLVAVKGAEAADAKRERELTSAAAKGIEKARTAEAPDYAGETFGQAEKASADLGQELAAQRSRFPLLRSYGRAEDLARLAKASSDKAGVDAAVRKQAVKTEATALIANTKTALQAARSVRPAQEVNELQRSLASAETALTAGRFLDARAAAERVQSRLPRDILMSPQAAARRSKIPGGG